MMTINQLIILVGIFAIGGSLLFLGLGLIELKNFQQEVKKQTNSSSEG
jgi:hypothetical protein